MADDFHAEPQLSVPHPDLGSYEAAGILLRALTAPIRLAVPVYSVNVAALAAVEAALEDREYVEDYLRQVEESKRLLYAACDRLGLHYWKSASTETSMRWASACFIALVRLSCTQR